MMMMMMMTSIVGKVYSILGEKSQEQPS